MNKEVIEKKIEEINNIFEKKQYQVSEKRALELLNYLQKNGDYYYDSYISLIIIYTDSLSKNIKNLKALEELERFLKDNPFEEKLLTRIYELCIKMKRLQRAEEILINLINVQPENINLRTELIKLYTEKGEHKKALFELNTLINSGLSSDKLINDFFECIEKQNLILYKLNKLYLLENSDHEELENILEEIKSLQSIENNELAFEMLDNIFNHLISKNKIDEYFINLFAKYYQFYLKNGKRSSFAGLFIKLLCNYINSEDKYKNLLYQIALDTKMTFIYGFINKENKNYQGFDQNEVTENIIYLLHEKTLLESSGLSISDYINNNEIIKTLPENISCYVNALVL